MIWCVEDETNIREMEVYTLNSTGFEAKGFADGEEMFRALLSETPDLILMDVMLPGEDGVELLKKLRAETATARIPVIMATAKGMEYDKVQSLDLGADDYLVKPFGMMEMVSRVKAVLRRTKMPPVQQILKLDGLLLNLDQHAVTVDGENVELTYKEFEILHVFMKNLGKVYSREQLFEKVWGGSFMGESRTVDMHIRTLRQKIGSYGNRIKTVRNVGYRMEIAEDE